MSDRSKIAEGELAVRLTSDITGGLGNHAKGAVLRDLSESAYNTLVQAGGHQALPPGSTVSEAKVEDTIAPPAPTGTAKTK